MNPFPFRNTTSDLLHTISEIVAQKPAKPAPPPVKPYDKYSPKPAPKPHSEGDTHGGGATSGKNTKKPSVRPGPQVVLKPTTPRVTEPLKTESVEVSESHSRAALEKMSITQLRALLKKYTAKPGSGRELADIRGLLRAKGAGSVLDEARKGLGKTKYGQALKALGDAAERIKANPPKAPVNPFKKPVQEETLNEGGVKAAIEDFMYDTLTAAAVRDLQPIFKNTAIRGAQLRARVAGVLKRHGVPSMALGTSSAQIVIDNFDTFFGEVNEAMTPCEKSALARLKGANAEDLKEKGGKAGEKAHKRLHKTVKAVLGGDTPSVQNENVIRRTVERVRNKLGGSGWKTDAEVDKDIHDTVAREDEAAARKKREAESDRADKERAERDEWYKRDAERKRREARERDDSSSNSKSDPGGRYN